MKFAENNRISHRQLYRQVVLSFSAPFLLCLFGRGKINGISGIVAVAAAAVLLTFYVRFLIRQESCYSDIGKYAGNVGCFIMGIFFLVYIVLTIAYLLRMLGNIVPETLVTGVSGNWIIFFALVACGFGAEKGMQRRGRVADVMGGVFLVIIVLILVLCAGQAKVSYTKEMADLAEWNMAEVLRAGYGILCAFSGISLFPFLLEYVEKSGSAWKPMSAGIFTVAGIVIGMLVLLSAILGWDRVNQEVYPVLPLLAGANLPGNVLARFDVLWMAFLLFGVLFAVGSLMHYGHLLIRKTNLGTGRYWLPTLIFFVAIFQKDGFQIDEYYGEYLAYFFVPAVLVLQVFFMLLGKEKKKKRVSAGMLCFLLTIFVTFSGCGGVEPEKRNYPLAMGVDFSEDMFTVTYGMADLPEATGQDKPEEGEDANVITLRGKDFQEIGELYNRSQEKYLDLGHLEILVLGEGMMEENEAGDHQGYKKFMTYIKEQPFIGENIYVFQTENPEALVGWKNQQGTSLGEYVTGIMENRNHGQKEKGVTLREVYYQDAKREKVPELPEIVMGEGELEIFW